MPSSDPIRIWVGCAANGEDAESQSVLEYTLRKHSQREIEITWMRLSRDPASPFYSDGNEGWNTRSWSTPFSGFRWAVPWLCNFRGRAIYMDSDMIVRADIGELWDLEMRPGTVLASATGGKHNRFDVVLWDCAAAQGVVAAIEWQRVAPHAHRTMVDRMRSRRELVHELPAGWNCLDGEGFADLNDPAIKVCHYTKMKHQVHLGMAKARLERRGLKHWYDGHTATHPRRDLMILFKDLYADAIRVGLHAERYEPAELYGAYRKKSYAAH